MHNVIAPFILNTRHTTQTSMHNDNIRAKNWEPVIMSTTRFNKQLLETNVIFENASLETKRIWTLDVLHCAVKKLENNNGRISRSMYSKFSDRRADKRIYIPHTDDEQDYRVNRIIKTLSGLKNRTISAYYIYCVVSAAEVTTRNAFRR